MMHFEPTLGTRVPLHKIESELKSMWRQTVDAADAIPITKASTMNLVIFIKDQANFVEISQNIAVLLEHHPGRIIITFTDAAQSSEEIEAYASFFCQYSQKTSSKTCCDLITIKTSSAGEELLSGIIMPLLLPDLPVIFWCTDICQVRPELHHVLHYTERIIVNSPLVFNSLPAMLAHLQQLHKMNTDGKIADLCWAEMAPWREAAARLFDSPTNRKYLAGIAKVEISMPQSPWNMHAIYLAGWLAKQMNWQFSKLQNDGDMVRLYMQQENHPIEILLRQSDSEKMSLFTRYAEKTAIFHVTQYGNVLKATMEMDSRSKTINYINLHCSGLMEKMCTELDYPTSDKNFQSTLTELNKFVCEKL